MGGWVDGWMGGWVLLTKLEYDGIRGHALEWFKSYLVNRFHGGKF